MKSYISLFFFCCILCIFVLCEYKYFMCVCVSRHNGLYQRGLKSMLRRCDSIHPDISHDSRDVYSCKTADARRVHYGKWPSIYWLQVIGWLDGIIWIVYIFVHDKSLLTDILNWWGLDMFRQQTGQAFTIIHHHLSSSIISHHQPSSSIVHHPSSIIDHQPSAISHHHHHHHRPFSSIFIDHHPLSTIIHHHNYPSFRFIIHYHQPIINTTGIILRSTTIIINNLAAASIASVIFHSED